MPAVVLGCVLVLAGCGGGSSAAPGSDPVDSVALNEPPGDTGDNDQTDEIGATNDAPRDAPKNLTVQYDDDQQVLEWEPQPDAVSYEVLEDPDGSGPLPSVVIDTPTAPNSSRPLTLSMRLRPQASYSVRACTAAGCSEPSAAAQGNADALVSHLVKQRGYPGEGFGRAIALSADGGTLAVSVPSEATVYEGVVTDPQGDGGPPTDPPTGAVVVFTRSPVNGHWRQQAIIKPLNPLVILASCSGEEPFGASLALSADGSTLVVGSPGDCSVAGGVLPSSTAGAEGSPWRAGSGAVHVFARASDTWSEQAYIKTANPQAQDLFGASVAVSGDGNMLAVGAPQTNTYTGSVHLYLRNDAQQWMDAPIVRAGNAADYPLFGSAVALSQDGRTLAVSAPHEQAIPAAPDPAGTSEPDDNAGWQAGAVYVFTLDDGTWGPPARIQGSKLRSDDHFGSALALSADGSTLAVGAPGDDRTASATLGLEDAGAAYVFTRAGGDWIEADYLKAGEPESQSGFGASLALSSDGRLLAVGADRQSGDGSAAGAVFVYRRADDPHWPEWATVLPRRNTEDQRFGAAVAVSGEGEAAVLAIGAPNDGEPDPGQPSRGGPGVVFVY